MSLFDQLVTEALKNQTELSPLRSVVEKELLHHDILREMSEAGLLQNLTFMGGTCLRACYGSNRLSEDLDFTGGVDFKREQLMALRDVLISQLRIKYDLEVDVSDPHRETGNVDTWKFKVVTQPEQSNVPVQRINIDICAIPSYDSKPMVLLNHYGIDMGTSGLILHAESREEILANKLVALALRPNRIKNRDLWDIAWLRQQTVVLPLSLVVRKISDHKRTVHEFILLLEKRISLLQGETTQQAAFRQEMQRFLPPDVAKRTVESDQFWQYLCTSVTQEGLRVLKYLAKEGPSNEQFVM